MKIKARNLCAFKKLEYSLLQGHTTLVFGNNMDNDSQGSNGSGKSAMLEAMAIGLTGEPLRKIRNEEIINDAEEEAYVEVTLYNEALGGYMRVERTIARKSPQSTRVFRYANEGGVEEEVKQAGITDYNKYVLDTIGLTKADIHSNYILCKNKFTSFLSSSDREKKEIINRFSNGNMVDESIAALQADTEPITQELSAANTEVATISGRVEAIVQQIEATRQETAERMRKRAERIEEWKEKIIDKKASITGFNAFIRKTEGELDKVGECDQKIQELEKSKDDLLSCYTLICKEFENLGMTRLPQDYTAHVSEKQVDISKLQNDLADLRKQSDKCKKALDEARTLCAALKIKYDKFDGDFEAKYAKVKEKMEELGNTYKALESENAKLNSQHTALTRDVADLQNKLAGVIVCPKCQHEFVLDDNLDIAETRLRLQDREGEIRDIEATIVDNQGKMEDTIAKGKEMRTKQDSLLSDKTEWSKKLADAQVAVDKALGETTTVSSKAQIIESRIYGLNKSIENARSVLFDETFDILDMAYKEREGQIEAAKIDIANAKGAIQSYEESIKEIESSTAEDIVESLKKSQAKYENELKVATRKQEAVQRKLDEYKRQEAVFVEFKTHLANTKIEALSHMTNEFLEGIGSDIRLSLSGYTVLKSGKVRDKISISLLRDGVDCGSFDKFSAGERARVELATILAMNKLTNASCEDGKGLDLLVLDEILEAVDEQGLSNIFNALNLLQITSLVVSHGNIAEGYPYKTVVNKLNGVSYLDGQRE